MGKRTVMLRLVATGVVIALAVVAFYGGTALRAVLSPMAASAYAANSDPAYNGPLAEVEKVVVDEAEQGIVILGYNQPLHIQTSAGGLSGYERAVSVAVGLNDGLAAGLRGDQIQAVEQAGTWLVMAGTASLVVANQEEADIWGLSSAELADIWAANLAIAVDQAWETPAEQETEPTEEEPTEEQPTEEETVEEGPAETEEEVTEEAPGEEEAGGEQEWQPEEPYTDKIVPIVSVGLGKRIGIARVNGPQSKVNQVQAVAQLETRYRDQLDIEIYVPISTKVPGQTLARIQGVGVTGVADLRIQ